MEIKTNRDLGNGVYLIGSKNLTTSKLQCNPYMIIDNEEAILVDPGSVLDFEEVYENIKMIISPSKIKYIVLSHQDPDLASCVPLFEKKDLQFKIATHWRAAVLHKYYGIKSEFYLVNEHDFKLTFGSNREIHFLLAPYLHFPGTIFTYDPLAKILFSADIFGAFGNKRADFLTDIDETEYIEAMKLFHENYMPDNSILSPVMEMLLTLDIFLIAPQHGVIINKNIKKFINILKDLECGAFLHPVKKDLAKNDGYLGICNQVLKRLYGLFSCADVKSLFKGTDIKLDQNSGLIIDFNSSGHELWDKFFQIINSKKGLSWIIVTEQLVKKIVKEYDIEYPKIFDSLMFSLDKKSEEINQENKRLQEINKRLEENLNQTIKKLTTDPITNLYNQTFFDNYIKNEFKIVLSKKENSALLFIDIDGFAQLRYKFGDEIANETLKKFTLLLEDFKEANHYIFKLEFSLFCYYLPNITPEKAKEIAESLRNLIASSNIFIEHLTVSIGVVNSNDFINFDEYSLNMEGWLKSLGYKKLSMAKEKAGNFVFSDLINFDNTSIKAGKILIIDDDLAEIEILHNFLTQAKFQVLTAFDGLKALELIEIEKPDLIISEILVPKIDGFNVREKMMDNSILKQIPFIIVSKKKNDKSIIRALSLNIEHYFKKPYDINELIGTVKNKFQTKKN